MNNELDAELLERETARIMKAMSEEEDEETFLQEQFADFDEYTFYNVGEEESIFATKLEYVRERVLNKMVLAKEEDGK